MVALSAAGSVELRDVRKSYGSSVAVRNISLAVRPGEFMTLLGPSGSGKTTTLMMIAGFEQPDHGAIAIDGRDITHVPSHQRNIGVAFQNYALFPHMTVAENIAFSLKMRDLPRQEIRERVGAALELVQLIGLDGRYPRQLSGGQQQRVALARALVFRPALLLLDEPLGALDRLLREHMQLELRQMHERLTTTMIYVTHDQDEALLLSDRIAVMNGGRIEQIGTPAEVYERPATRFVAQFIGECNFLAAQVAGVRPGVAELRLGDAAVAVPTTAAVAAGEAVELAIRPEKILLGDAASSRDELHDGLVEDVIYIGHIVKCVVRLGGSTAVVVKQQSRAATPVPAKGERVRIGWDRSDAQLFRAGPAQ